MPRVTFLFLLLLLTGCGEKPEPPKPAPVPVVVAPPPDEPPPGKLEKPATVDFRILVSRKTHADLVAPAIASLEEKGKDAIIAPGLRWFPIWGLAYFAYSGTSIEMAARNPEQFINEILKLVAVEHRGELYVLTWDTPDKALKADEGNWAVTEAFTFGKLDPGKITVPDRVAFSLDNYGARRLGEITSKNIGQSMTIVVEGKLVMSSKIDQKLERSGVIAGGSRAFSIDELAWLRRKLLNLPDPPPAPEPVEEPAAKDGDAPAAKDKPAPDPAKPPAKDPA